MTQITLDELNRMDRGGFVAALGEVFEHAPWVAEIASGARPFASLSALYEAMIAAVRSAGDDRQMTLIKGHPDLAGKAAREGAITDDSKIEQSSAGLDRLSDDEFAAFHRLNDAYHAKFDIPFIVCVRRHGKDSILRQFERRLKNDAATERDAALAEIFRIVALRLAQRVKAPDRLRVHGVLSTHVLDTHGGRPAEGVAIELLEIAASRAPRVVARTITNADGRTDRPLIADEPIPIGQYELRFDIGYYFARQGTPTTEPPFLGIIPIRFAVAEPEAHYHVPIIVTPWSYSTYRGS
ncbi:MAG: 2-oxo-4-hydroxy-4-carboxy-5-ureidoimidazoline decarboxylase [Xanthobacteraceae bacterium]|jgi:2-oxo-4-hydroxy-4-carboxy-5-ureidoimidazoline decarboxylase